MQLAACTALVTALLYVAYRLAFSKGFSARRPFPPGPRGDPIIGNARQMPATFMWLKFKEWSQTYNSDVVHIRIFGRSLVVLNSYKAVSDLLEKRSMIYSDRPKMTMAAELMGFEWATIFTPFGPQFVKNRKLLHFALSPSASRSYAPMQEAWTNQYLLSLLDSPEHYADHVRRLSSVIAMELAYGKTIATSAGDVFVRLAQQALDQFSIGVSGGWLVDFLPSMKHIPAWVSGAHFQTVASEAKPIAKRILEEPFKALKANMAAGIYEKSFTHHLLRESGHVTGEFDEEDLVKRNAATLFGAGADTTVSSMMSAVLALTLHPEIQAKAQAEIDLLTGSERLPTLADRGQLPFINAIVKEVLRWNPAGPIGSPRRLMEDDTYNGWFLPGGATIIPNVWAIMHDEVEYPEPFEFNPDRFMVPNPPRDPHQCAFGFGRRICPGLHLTSATLFVFIAQTLATFNIEKAVDNKGAPITPKVEFLSGVISHPAPFQCNMVPRNQRSAELIRQAADATDATA